MLDSSTDRVGHAIEALTDLRAQAQNHYETLNNWLIIDAIDEALVALKGQGS